MADDRAAPIRSLTDDPLGWMLGAEAAGFLGGVYERRPLIVRHEDPGRFRSLLSIDAVDRAVAESDLREGQLEMADAGRDLDRSAWVAETGAIDRVAVAGLYARGATIILNQLQQSDARLAGFCRTVERVFSCHAQTNVYLTPPAAQGFHTHYDNHDVFILQVEGEKAWRLYEQVDAPYRGERFQRGERDDRPAVETFVLKAGDCAYVPRGLVHDASTSGEGPSLHVTVGLIVRTWAELVLEAVSEVCVAEPSLRRSLPPGFARGEADPAAMEATFRALMTTVAERARIGGALELMTDGHIRSREADVRGAVLAGAAPLAARYSARPSPWRLAEDGERLVLIAPHGDIGIAADQRADVELALSGAAFAPDALTGGEAETLLRRLTAAGLIEAA